MRVVLATLWMTTLLCDLDICDEWIRKTAESEHSAIESLAEHDLEWCRWMDNWIGPKWRLWVRRLVWMCSGEWERVSIIFLKRKTKTKHVVDSIWCTQKPSFVAEENIHFHDNWERESVRVRLFVYIHFEKLFNLFLCDAVIHPAVGRLGRLNDWNKTNKMQEQTQNKGWHFLRFRNEFVFICGDRNK